MPNYEASVKGKTAEQILASADSDDPGPVGEYLRAAAGVRSNQELLTAQNVASSNLVDEIRTLIKTLNKASNESGDLGKKVLWLTLALVGVGGVQAVATAWPYLVWWWHNR